MKHAAIVLPAHNESKRIQRVLTDILENRPSFPEKLEVIVVDDGSSDATSEKAAAMKSTLAKAKISLHVLRHRINLGKGNAAKTGCDAALRIGVDGIALMDSDGQHLASDAAKLFGSLSEYFSNDSHVLVLGVRKFSKKMPLAMRFGNKSLSAAIGTLFGIRVSDTQSGLRAFPAHTYTRLRWMATHYAMEAEMLVLASYNAVKLVEVEIATIYHDNYKGTTPLDGLRIFQRLLFWKVFGGRGESDILEVVVE